MKRFSTIVLSVLAFVCSCVVFADLRSFGAPTNRAAPVDRMYRPQAGNAVTAPNVWITDALVKVHTDATPSTQTTVQLSAARNEFESLQVHVRAGTDPVQMSVTVSDFVNSQTGDVISSATNVFLYREAYLNITTLSDANGSLGVTPDPLIPTKDPYFLEPRNAFPVTVPINSVQSAWIDILVPASAPAGTYSATVTVSDGSTVLAALTAQLNVWNFTIPSTASLRTAFGISWNAMCVQAYGSYENCGQYPGSGGSPDRGVELTHIAEAIFFLDHRVTLTDNLVYSIGHVSDWSHLVATYGPLMNGTAGTLLKGAQLTNLQYPKAPNPPVASDIQDWVTQFTSYGWLGTLFQYTCDEPPNGCSWEDALALESLVHGASASMKTLITTDLAGATQHNLLADLNILTPIVGAMEPQDGTNQRSSYDAWLQGAPDRHLWWYQACPSHGSCSNGTVGPATSTWPSYMIDATPVRNRIFQWMAFLDRIEGELYYQADYCWYACTDPWVSVYAFGGNGDGTLFYPGTADRIGGTTPVPVPSIRLKHIRDGLEDFEYLMALSKAGDDQFARSIAVGLITNASTFNNDPQAFANARMALGNRLHQLNSPALQVSPASNIASSGSVGGPFSPLSFQYQLSASSGSVNYSITNVPSWLDASSTSGTVNTTTTTITFTVNANANGLATNTYVTNINFNNTTSSAGNTTRTATLTVTAAVPQEACVTTTGSMQASPDAGDAQSFLPSDLCALPRAR